MKRSIRETLDDDSLEDTPITVETIKEAIKWGYSGNVRVCTGRIYTTEEFEERRKYVMSRRLP